MAKDERILAIDIGSTSIKLCEFEYGKGNAISLVQFAYREYEEDLTDGTRQSLVSSTISQLLSEGRYKSKKALISVSGQNALMRISRLPEITEDKKKIRALAEFEATNNIPFPIEDVVWDYQMITSSDEETKDVLSVVIKNEVVEQYTNAVMENGLDPILVDVAPAACYNAARANGLGSEECVIILNLGGKSTNLLFVEGDRFYARNIPTAGQAITQAIAKEFGVSLPEADEMKRRHGFVALGGEYGEPESETAATISKIIRTVLARLHGEISRSINVYCAQQHGNKPVKMYLTGGSSIMKNCDAFFQEKLGIPVEYLNPFSVVELHSSVDKENLETVAHMFAEVIGLGLRYSSPCPVELTLLPVPIRRQQSLDKKKPYFMVSGVIILATLAVLLLGISKTATALVAANEKMEAPHRRLESAEKALKAPESASLAQLNEYNSVGRVLLQRASWATIYNEIYRLKPDNLWINALKPVYGEMIAYDKDLAYTPKGMAREGGDDLLPQGDGPDNDPLKGEGSVPIVGLYIIGTCVQPVPRANTKNPVAWSSTMDDVISFKDIFELPEKPALVDETAPKPEEGAEDSGEEKQELSPAQFKKQQFDLMKKIVVNSQSPELAYEAALRMSPLFDADATMTAKTRSNDTYTYPLEQTDNAGRKRYRLVTFKMQVKFATPMDYYNFPKRNISDLMGEEGYN